MKVIVVVAHPDDEALGCGGTIAKLSQEGHRVTVLLPVRRCDPRGVANWPALLGAFHESCGILGADPLVLDRAIEETRAEAEVHLLHDAIVDQVDRADLVMTHWPGDVNQVHRGVARAVEVATRPFRRRRDVWLFEVPSSTDQVFGVGDHPPFRPTLHVVLDESHAKRKAEAVALYETETAAGRTPEDVERRLRVRGAQIGVDHAESFVVARQFR